MDEALLIFHSELPYIVSVDYTSDYCYKCLYQPLARVGNGQNNISVVVSTQFTLTLKIARVDGKDTLCKLSKVSDFIRQVTVSLPPYGWGLVLGFFKIDTEVPFQTEPLSIYLLPQERAGRYVIPSLSQTFEEAGHYSLWMTQSGPVNDVKCSLTVDRSQNNVYLRKASLSRLLHSVITIVSSQLHCFLLCHQNINLEKACSVATPFLYNMKYGLSSNESKLFTEDRSICHLPTALVKLLRLRFSLTVMVFVNYGGGGYWFFHHAPWNGTSVVLAFTSMHRKGVSRLQLLRKTTWRTIVLMLIGFCFMNYSPKDGYWSHSNTLGLSGLSEEGRESRLTVCNSNRMFIFVCVHKCVSILVLATDTRSASAFGFHLFCPRNDADFLSPQRHPLEDSLLVDPHSRFGFILARVDLHCVAGDHLVVSHFLSACSKLPHVLYHTTEPFDPEGVLGTINSIVMGFLGMQRCLQLWTDVCVSGKGQRSFSPFDDDSAPAGKILLFYRKMNKHILARFLIWALILGISAAILSKCTRDEGFIPVNKNLWSLSFVTCMGCMSFVLLGMNSIFVYVGHSLLGFYFPFSWEMRFQDSHWEQLFQNMWGTALWLFIAYLLYRKQFFLKI
ncbi:Heparan-alpha-glucosaminide N-acetyltransferase [Labeo rohita]|uniref:Heparan-alpha-glucosaminide N-acetyltransferase n=1 Tax=Labeo rohita TaxID=84645 RepID=A0ABQ8M5K0_LABRO|nr:Heparan-alpha-glucosaminide N-acetyltransferase [Labeo rohita]